MGIIEDITAKALSQAWGLMPADTKDKIKQSALATETGLHEFNTDIADDSIGADELEAAIKKLLDAMGTTTGQALQAWFWSLFKHA